MDSYAGKDIPRYMTCLLYLAYEPAVGGHLRLHDVDGVRHVDVAPTPGQLVLFFSQEVLHEVRASTGERLALTLWIWDLKKDECGR